MGYSYLLSFSLFLFVFCLDLFFLIQIIKYGVTLNTDIIGKQASGLASTHFFFPLFVSLYIYLCVHKEKSSMHVLDFDFVTCKIYFRKNNVVIQAHCHIPNNISKDGTSSATMQSNSTVRECSCTVHASCGKAKAITHIEFCLGKLGSTLENKQPETRKLHLYGRETLMSCRVMAALPCRHIAKASFLSRALHGSKWFSIFPNSRQNGSLKCATT